MAIYSILSKVSSVISIFFSIFAFVCYMLFRRLVIKSGDKRIEEIETQLNRLLNLMTIGTILSGVFGLIAIFTR